MTGIRALIRGPLAVLLAVIGGTAAAETPHSDSVLWRIQTSGDAAPSYVFGTMHTDRQNILDLPGKVERTFDNAERYAFEIDFSGGYLRQATQSMLDTSDGPALKQQLGPESWEQLKAVAQERSLPPQALDQFEPWAVAVMLSIPQTKPRQMLDRVLQRRARKTGAPVEGLETVEEQLAVFQELSEEKQLDLLARVAAMRAKGRIAELHDQAATAYREEDLARLMELSEANPMMGDPKAQETFQKRMVVERNTRMAERMQPLINKGGAFVAIGALHLPGKKGVIQQLEDAGYEVSAVR